MVIFHSFLYVYQRVIDVDRIVEFLRAQDFFISNNINPLKAMVIPLDLDK